MEQSFIDQLWAGVQLWFANINWMFVPIFIIVTWLFNEGTDSQKTLKWLNWLQKIGRTWRVLIGGIILGIPYCWIYNLNNKEEIVGVIYAILVGMIMWKMGIDTVFEWIKKKFWPSKNE